MKTPIVDDERSLMQNVFDLLCDILFGTLIKQLWETIIKLLTLLKIV